MGSNMQKQAIPIKVKETALVQTGIEKQITKLCGSIITAEKSGYIKATNMNTIKIIGTKESLNIQYKNKAKVEKILNNIENINIWNTRTKYKKKIYIAGVYKKSNPNAINKREPLIKKNQWIKKGETIIDNSETINGKICIGKNLLIAYMTWDGYNFEDAISINKQLVENEILTSLNFKSYKAFILKNEDEEVRKVTLTKKQRKEISI